MARFIFLYVTAPDPEIAETIAKRLVHLKHAACVNIHNDTKSVYAWNGQLETQKEVVMFIKTTAEKADAAHATILELHPFDTPCITSLPIENNSSHQPFLTWIATTLREK